MPFKISLHIKCSIENVPQTLAALVLMRDCGINVLDVQGNSYTFWRQLMRNTLARPLFHSTQVAENSCYPNVFSSVISFHLRNVFLNSFILFE